MIKECNFDTKLSEIRLKTLQRWPHQHPCRPWLVNPWPETAGDQPRHLRGVVHLLKAHLTVIPKTHSRDLVASWAMDRVKRHFCIISSATRVNDSHWTSRSGANGCNISVDDTNNLWLSCQTPPTGCLMGFPLYVLILSIELTAPASTTPFFCHQGPACSWCSIPMVGWRSSKPIISRSQRSHDNTCDWVLANQPSYFGWFWVTLFRKWQLEGRWFKSAMCQYVEGRWKSSRYPLVNKHRPWKSPIFNGN